MTGLVVRLAEQPLDSAFDTAGGMRDRALAGEAVALVILTRVLIADLAAGGHPRTDSVAGIGAVSGGLAVKAGAPLPDIATPAAVAATLRAAYALYCSAPARATAAARLIARLIAPETAATRRTAGFLTPNSAIAEGRAP